MIMSQLRARVGILLISGSAAILAALRIQAVESRVSQVELAPRADPSEVEHLASALRGAEEKITSSLREIQDLERKSEHTAELDRRIEELRGRLEQAAAALADQQKRLAE